MQSAVSSLAAAGVDTEPMCALTCPWALAAEEIALAAAGPMEDNLLTPRQGGALQLAAMSHRRSRLVAHLSSSRQVTRDWVQQSAKPPS